MPEKVDLSPSPIVAILTGAIKGLGARKKLEEEKAMVELKRLAEIGMLQEKEKLQKERELAVAKTTGELTLAGVLAGVMGKETVAGMQITGRKDVVETEIAGRKDIVTQEIAGRLATTKLTTDASRFGANRDYEGAIDTAKIVADTEQDKIKSREEIAKWANASRERVAEISKKASDFSPEFQVTLDQYNQQAKFIMYMLSTIPMIEDKGIREQLILFTVDLSKQSSEVWRTKFEPTLGVSPYPVITSEETGRIFKRVRPAVKGVERELAPKALGEQQVFFENESSIGEIVTAIKADKNHPGDELKERDLTIIKERYGELTDADIEEINRRLREGQ